MQNDTHQPTRNERREQQRRNQRRMGVSGRSVKLLLTIEQRRAAELEAQRSRPQPQR